MPGEELIRSEQVYDGRIMRVRRDAIRVNKATGPVETVRDVVETRNAVTLVPVDPDGNVLLVRQFRWAAAVPLLEAPAGMLEDGEAPEDGARRELREETGHAAGIAGTPWRLLDGPRVLDRVHVHLPGDRPAPGPAARRRGRGHRAGAGAVGRHSRALSATARCGTQRPSPRCRWRTSCTGRGRVPLPSRLTGGTTRDASFAAPSDHRHLTAVSTDSPLSPLHLTSTCPPAPSPLPAARRRGGVRVSPSVWPMGRSLPARERRWGCSGGREREVVLAFDL